MTVRKHKGRKTKVRTREAEEMNKQNKKREQRT